MICKEVFLRLNKNKDTGGECIREATVAEPVSTTPVAVPREMSVAETLFITLLGKKKKKSQKRTIAAAKTNRLTNDWLASATSIDADLQASLVTLRNRTRDLTLNDPTVAGIVRTIAMLTVGKGIQLQSQVMMMRPADRLHSAINEQIEAAWDYWSHASRCDVRGLLSLHDIERIALRAVIESGEVLIRLVKKPFGNSAIPLALEVIEADQLLLDQNSISRLKVPDGHKIKLGIEQDRWGRPVAYYLSRSHPGESPQIPSYQGGAGGDREVVRVSADEIIHLYYHERPNQTRGLPWLVSGVLRLRHLDQFMESALVSARVSAATMGFLERQEIDPVVEEEEPMYRERTVSPGVIEELEPGQTFKPFTPAQPTDLFSPFVTSQLRAIAAGIGLSYETIGRDYERVSYSSARQSMLNDRNFIETIQEWFVSNFHAKLFEVWLDQSVLSGYLNLPGYELNPYRFQASKWLCPSSHYIDPTKEINASVTAIENGLSTLTRELASKGIDLEQLLRERDRELEMIAQLGLSFNSSNPKNNLPNTKEVETAKET